jgi:hypothetical protein|tara:strand:- start:143 stop:652 length:510 start_codon:yes stop_codon:yes gene_type:complete
MTNETILNAARIIKEHGIFLETQNIIGNPIDDSFSDACDTVKLNSRIRPDYTWASLLNPYFGTDIWNYCTKNGFMNENIKFPSTYHVDSPLKLKDKKKILRIYELFSLMVKFPILFKYRDFITKLPLRVFYTYLRKIWKSYKYLKRYNIKLLLKEYLNIGVRYLIFKGG